MTGVEVKSVNYPLYEHHEFFRIPCGERPQIDKLSLLPIPDIRNDQLALFTEDSIMARTVEPFDAGSAMEKIRKHEGERIVSIDFGGDKATVIPYEVRFGSLVAIEQQVKTEKKVKDGANYLPFFERIAREAENTNTGVAISYGGPLEGTKPISIPNATDLFHLMQEKYHGDFQELFPTLLIANNDAQAGIKTAAIAAQKQLIQEGLLDTNGSILFPINGGGDGLAALINGYIIAMEVGHVPVIDALNPYHQKTPCGMLGRSYVCIERVAASGAGIEAIWLQQMGQRLSGKEISGLYQYGDTFARDLYNNAALLFAHGLIGAANINGIMKTPTDTAIAYHGGGFRVKGLMERTTQIIAKQRGFAPPTLFSDNFSVNGCAEGAVIAALCAPQKKKKLDPRLREILFQK
ncbi:MAG: ROK family protein [Microgenomates group bacterium]